MTTAAQKIRQLFWHQQQLRPLGWLAVWVVIALVYIGFGRFAYILTIDNKLGTMFWLPAGWVAAMVLRFGYASLPGIFLGDLVFGLLFRIFPPVVCLELSLSQVLMGAVICFLSRRWLKDSQRDIFLSLENLFKFLIIIALAQGLHAFISAWTIPSLNDLPEQINLLNWWISGWGGALVVAPFVLSWLQPSWPSQLKQAFKGESLLLMGFVALTIWFINQQIIYVFTTRPLAALLPLMIWSCLRFPVSVATLHYFWLTCLVIAIPRQNPIIPGADSLAESVLALQFVIISIILNALVVMILYNDRKALAKRLKRQALFLEDQLEATQAELAKTALAITEAIPVGTYNMVLEPGADLAYFSFMSDRFLEVTGLEREVAAADPLQAFACVHPDDYDAWVQLNAEAFAQKTPFLGETRVVVNGEIRWIRAESVPRDLPDGTTVWEGAISDITDYIATQERLAKSEQKLRRIIDNLPLAIAIYESDSQKFTFANQLFQSLFGYTLDDIPTLDHWMRRAYPDPDYRAEVVQRWQAYLDHWDEDQGFLEASEYQVTCKDGSQKDVLWYGLISDDLVLGVGVDITARKRIEREVIYQKNLLRAQLETTPTGVLMVDDNHKVLLYNERFLKLWSIPEPIVAQVKAAGDDDFFLGYGTAQTVDPDAFLKRVNDLYENPEETSIDEFALKNGTIIQRFSAPILDEHGNYMARIWSFRDITATKHYERVLEDAQNHLAQINEELERRVQERTAALQESEAKLNVFIRSTPASMAMLDQNMCYLAASQRWIEEAQLDSVDEILGRSHYEIFPNPEVKWIQAHQQGLAGQGTKCEKDSYLLPDGRQLYVRWEVQPWYTVDGAVGGIVIFTENITSLIDLLGKYESSSRRLNLALEAGSIGSWEWEIGGDRLIWDERMYDIYGLPRREDRSMNFDTWANTLIPKQRDITASRLLELVATPDQITYEQEFSILWPNHEQREIRAYGFIVRDDQGQATKVVGVNFDITREKQAQETLALANAQLRRAAEMKDNFLAMMSHELRTPLNAILGMTESLQDEIYGSVSILQKRSLGSIESAGEHLLHLINDILDVAKIDSGQVTLELEPTNIPDLCQSSLTFVREFALKKQIQLTQELPPSLPDFYLDQRRLKQVLINLLNNAVKFTPEGGTVKLQVIYPQTTTDIGCPCLRFNVIDTGIGIDPEDIERLFEPFVQVESNLSRRYEGTGLGLTLVQQIAQLHGGTVKISSELRQGSCFSLDLPLRPVEGTGTRTAKDGALAQEQSKKLEKPGIIVLTVPGIQQGSFSNYLKAKGYNLKDVADLDKAIALIENKKGQLIILEMAKVNSESLALLQALRDRSTLPIICLCEKSQSGDCSEYLTEGANDYLCKPFRFGDLVSLIEQYVTVSPQA